MNPKDPITIRPNRLDNAMKTLVPEALVLSASIASILYGDIVVKVIGFALLLFGMGGIFSLIAIVRRDWSLALTESGIEMNTLFGRSFVQWENIEEINVIKIDRLKMVGIRIFSYDQYLKGRNIKTNERIEKTLTPFFWLTDLLRKSKILKILDILLNPLAAFIATFNKTNATSRKIDTWFDAWRNKAKGVRGIMEANRAAYGCDLTIASSDLDRSPEKFSEFLHTFRNKVLKP
jgi:hypothetical protein